jgi:hypothetical protein
VTSALYLHYNGALEHINKRMCIVPMDKVRPAGRIFHEKHQTFLAVTNVATRISRADSKEVGIKVQDTPSAKARAIWRVPPAPSGSDSSGNSAA